MKALTYIKYAVLLCCTLFFQQATAQKVNDELRVLLAGKNNLTDIMAVVDTYYTDRNDDGGTEFESDYLKWKRWEWYMSSHLGSEGEFVDISHRLLDARRRTDQQFPIDSRNINSNWLFIGPSSSPNGNTSAIYNGLGRVDRIAFHPTQPNTIYIGTPAGGLWKTTDDGVNWTNLTDHLPSLAISGIVISHDNADVIYILTGDGDSNTGTSFIEQFGYLRASVGVLKSTDGGVNWSQTGTFPGTTGQYTGFRLTQSPTNANVLLATTTDGLYRTNNGGISWTQVRTGLHYDVVFKPFSGSKVYATAPGVFIYSDDGGVSWETDATFDFSLCAGERVEIAVAPTYTSKVYLLAGPEGNGTFCGLFMSLDSGGSFTRQSNSPNVFGSEDDGLDGGGATDYINAIAAKTNNSTRILVASLTIWRSTNSGSSFSNSTGYNENDGFAYIHPDVHDIAYNPLTHNAYAATDGGLYKTTDDGVTWTDLSSNIETSQFYHMRIWNASSVKMLGGAQDNGIKYRETASSSFKHIAHADGFDIVFNPLNGQPGYCTVNKSTLRFSSNGTSTTGINPISSWYKTLAVHNTRPDTVLCGAANIWRSYNGGSSWTDEGNSGSWSLTSCPSNNSRFYAAGGAGYNVGNQTNSGVYVSSNNGDSWTTISGNSGFPATWTKITDVSARGNNSTNVWVTMGGFTDGQKVYRSTNTGSSWTNMTANLPNVPIYCVAIDNNNGAYVGTDIGVFYRSSSMTNWMPWANGLPNSPVTGIAVQQSSNFVRVSTFGRGMWLTNRATDCSDNVTVNGNLPGDQHYEANISITSTGDVIGGEGTFVSFQSGNYIDLETGFEVVDNSQFIGHINPCGQGGIPSIWQPGSESTASRQSTTDGEVDLNIKHAFPLGSIDNVDYSESTASFSITVREAGPIEFILVHQDKQEEVVFSKSLTKGMHEIDLDLSEIEPGFYHIIMYNDQRVAHFQELEKK